MKHFFRFYIVTSIICAYSHITVAYAINNNRYTQAFNKFQRMKVSQIKNLNIQTLDNEDLIAFKTLAKSIFSQEIASAECFSQANRRKYEVMYQKIGEIDAFNNTAYLR